MTRHDKATGYMAVLGFVIWCSTLYMMVQNAHDMERMNHQVDRLNEQTRALNVALARDADKLQATEAREKTVTDLYLNTLLPDGGGR